MTHLEKGLKLLLWFSIFLLVATAVSLLQVTTVLGSETRTLNLDPAADSFVTPFQLESNFGKDLSYQCEFKREYIQIHAQSFTAGTSKVVTFPIYLTKDSEISCSFEVTSGGNKDVDFYLTSGTHRFIEAYRTTNYSFTFTAPYSDTYVLNFDNTFSWITGKGISLSDVVRTDYRIYATPAFMMFDLSDIPPEATILESKLSFYVSSSLENPVVGVYYCSNNNWKENTIQYTNAPFEDISTTSTTHVSVGSSPQRYELDVISDVIKGAVNGKLTEVLAVNSGGKVDISSRESTNHPQLEIKYEYVSINSTIDPNFIIEGQNVGIILDTAPSQQGGRVRIQYSTDQIKWYDVVTYTGGSTYYAWNPEVTGQVYVRGVWGTSWNGGSYSTLSSVNGVFIFPIYLLILIPTIIIVAVVGVLLIWRLRRRKTHEK